MTNPVLQHLHTLPVRELGQIGQLISIRKTDSVEAAIKTLADNKILSVPVLDSKAVIGVLDIVDVVYFLHKVAPDQKSLSANELQTLEIAGRAIAMEEVGEIISKYFLSTALINTQEIDV